MKSLAASGLVVVAVLMVSATPEIRLDTDSRLRAR